ncbi:MAG TPA: hypothetical protein VFO89_06240 [Thermoanaerobaculia bacterium]|nr:hypothetical protein [Thermoanaerobaculia bacterium]
MSAQPLTIATSTSQAGPEPNPPIPVQVFVNDGVVTVDHDPVPVRWAYNGTIAWAILPTHGSFDIERGGVVFYPNAPFTRVALTDTLCVYRVLNDNLQTVGSFAYSIFVDTTNGKLVTYDPTVENESPPLNITQ